jgi:hypothetical protein
MRRLALSSLLSLAALGILPASGAPADDAGAAAPYWRQCGSQPHLGAGWYHVRAHHVHCGKARDVARRFTHRALAGDETAEPLGFSCVDESAGLELAHVSCRRSQHARVQRVRFSYGA